MSRKDQEVREINTLFRSTTIGRSRNNVVTIDTDPISLLGPKQGSNERREPGVNIGVVWVTSPHQFYARVANPAGNLGSPNFWQSVTVNVLNGPPPQGGGFPGVQLDVFGGTFWPTPTDWHPYEPQRTEHSYFLGGLYHDNDRFNWDHGLDTYQEIHSNGVYWKWSYDDVGDGRFDDYIIEGVILWTFPLHPVEGIARASEHKYALSSEG